MLKGLVQDIRIDGRARLQRRGIRLATNTLPQASGSATLILDTTFVMVGIHATLIPILGPSDRGRLTVSVDCSPSLMVMEGGLEDRKIQLQNSLAQVLENPCIFDRTQLLIGRKEEARHGWSLQFDVFLLHDGGNMLEAASIAMRAALYSLKLPKVTLDVTSSNEETQGELSELTISTQPEDRWSPVMMDFPILMTAALIGSHFVLDPLPEEELCADAIFYFAINHQGKVTSMRKDRGGFIGIKEFQAFLEHICTLGRSFLAQMDALLLENVTKKSALLHSF